MKPFVLALTWTAPSRVNAGGGGGAEGRLVGGAEVEVARVAQIEADPGELEPARRHDSSHDAGHDASHDAGHDACSCAEGAGRAPQEDELEAAAGVERAKGRGRLGRRQLGETVLDLPFEPFAI